MVEYRQLQIPEFWVNPRHAGAFGRALQNCLLASCCGYHSVTLSLHRNPGRHSRANLIIALVVAMSCAQGEEIGDSFRSADAQLAAGRTKEFERAVKSLARTDAGRPWAALLVARWACVRGEAGAADAALRAAFSGDTTVLPVPLQLAYAETLRRLRRYDDAVAVADRIGRGDSGTPRAQAACLVADVLVDRQRWSDALEWLKTAQAAIRHSDQSDVEKDLREQIAARLARVEQMIELLTHGLGFQLYRTANGQRMRGDHTAALATYDRLLELHVRNKDRDIGLVATLTGPDDPTINDLPIHDIYAAAADVYRCHCLLALHRPADAITSLKRVVQDQQHPYRGEGLRLLGDASLANTGDPIEAERWYTAAISALGEQGQMARALDRYAVPQGSRTRTKPPEQMRGVRGWGNIEWYTPAPEQVLNAETCNWYVGYQTLQAHVQRALCRFLAGRSEEAVADLDAILRYDAADRQLTERNLPSNYLRLRDGFRSGRLYATPAELGEFKGKALPKIVQAEVLFETEQWDAAIAAYDSIAGDQTLSLSKGARAYLDYVRACAYVFAGKRDQATRFMTGFSGPTATYRKTITYWRSLFLQANLDSKNGTTLLAQGAQDCPDPSLRLDFLMRLGQLAYCVPDDREAASWFSKVKKLAPPDDHRSIAARNYLNLIANRAPAAVPPAVPIHPE